MSTIADLITAQREIMENMNKLYVNFKKEGKERRTAESIKRRLQSLEALWKDFSRNHEKLISICDEGDDQLYFGDDCIRTKQFYDEVKEQLLKNLEDKITRTPSPSGLIKSDDNQTTPSQLRAEQPGTSTQQTTTLDPRKPILSLPKFVFHNVDTTKEIDELMRKQQSNFKALARTIAKINLNILTEKWEFQDVLKNIESRWGAIDTLHWEIDSKLEDEDQKYDELFNRYEYEYNEIKKSINIKMGDLTCRHNSTPLLDIPIFSGSYQQWESFKNLFIESIHKNNSLSSAQKMQILKSKLRGEAEKLIQHLHISTENYQACWDILNQRYNNKKLIFNSHMNIIMSLPLTHQQNSINIKKIHDTTKECLNAIKNLGVDISNWDPIIIYLVSQKLDTDTYSEYINSLPEPRDLPYLQDFLTFLEGKFIALESSRRKTELTKYVPNKPMSNQQHQFNQSFTNNNQYRKIRETVTNPPIMRDRFVENRPFLNHSTRVYQEGNRLCVVCKGSHALFVCNKFRGLSIQEKRDILSQFNLCKNCLLNHHGAKCESPKTCFHCHEKHNTLLHNMFLNEKPITNQNHTYQANRTKCVSHVSNEQQAMTEVLLATAEVNVLAADGTYKTLRALIDQGSQTSIISENAAQLLSIPRQRCKGIIYGIGEKENNCKGILNITIASLHNDFTMDVEAFIMNNLIKKLPNQSFNKPSLPYLKNLQLADSNYNQSRPIDILLGAEVYSEIMLSGIIREDPSHPIAQQTQLGWILCGNVKSYYCNVILNSCDDIKKFWEIEDLNDECENQSIEDLYCMQQFKSETKRDPKGRYVVRLPMKPDVKEKLGDSKTKAIAQFYQLERNLRKNHQVASDYKEFMNEYLRLGHMKLSPSNHAIECYLPHHCVLRADSTTSAIRVVFNGSAKTTTGYSVNDLMYSGPNLQHDLLSIIVKWRQYMIGYIADAEKMYRQILVHAEDQQYQKILWRDSPRKPIQEFHLTTVTYGLKASPFLALMTMKQLAKDESYRYPEAATAIENNLYMDDLLHGQHTIEDAKRLKIQLIELCKAGGFNLRKWKSNEPALMEPLPDGEQQQSFVFKQEQTTKTLGLKWSPQNDQFSFDFKIVPSIAPHVTKRQLLSEISKVFDPLGWLSPVTTKLKLLFQSIWQLNIGWDDNLPENINQEWKQIQLDLQNINETIIPRWLNCHKNDNIELHGFCDASTKAYACVIFCKTKTSIVIIAAKARLVPLKKSVTLPKLELCAAHLLAKLTKIIQSCLSEHHVKTFGWSDSTAVLGWLSGDTSRWKAFVANRVNQITEIIPASNWNYVKSEDNPADCASRGITAAQLNKHPTWWRGPGWLLSFKEQSSKSKTIYSTQEEIKLQTNIVTTKMTHENDVIGNLITNNSNYTRACRVLAWIRRAFSRDQNKPTYLTINELKNSRNLLIKHVQQSEFIDEINNLLHQTKLKSKSKLLPLNPYVDTDGLVRIGGRLKHSNLNEEMKNPIILPHNHHLTNIIIDHAHTMTFHGGARLTLAWIRRAFWIIGGNNTIKKRLRQCWTCRRAKFENRNQLMGDLPAPRINQTRPFYHTGVDFTGYVDVKSNKGRGIKCTKGYIAVFVCMATKAVHLELVSDLTSSAFIAALRRMSARRGAPRHIYSDNGTNFVGANNTIQKEYINLKNIMDETISQMLNDMQIEWHFNAPSWPSAGGIWEAAVKSLKYHLRRVIGDQKLTYEEFITLLAQLEGCLNSRPLCAISEDPDDLDFLTPSHFLASGPVLTIIETEKDQRTRWQLTQKIYRDIWKRWQSEYLTQLNVRNKWQHTKENIKVNDIVIIQDIHVSPGKWALGKVLELHPGCDGLVRVVTLKTKAGIIKRPITKISFMPNYQENDKQQSQPPQQPNPDNHIQRKTNDKSKQRKTTQLNLCNLITMGILFFMFLLSPSNCSDFQTTNLKPNQTIYFDKISNMRQIRDEWKLVVFYDMDAYWEGISLATKYMTYLENVCQRIKTTSHCQLVLLHLRHCLTELDHYNEILTNHGQLSEKSHRRRRGLINAGGNIARSLFGILDDEFAQQYQKDLFILRSNQKYFNQLLKNQTSIIESEYNLINRIEKTIEQQHKTFNQHLLKLDKIANIMQDHIQENTDANEFALSSITANGILMNLKDIQQMLLNTITDIFHGKFNIHLLHPEQLTKELHMISGQISKELSLPIDNIQTDLTNIYHLLTVKTRFTKEFLIFEIKIPLVDRDNFEIYRLIPIPIEVNGKMRKIVVTSELLAINIQKDLQLPFTELQLQQCSQYNSETILCAHQIPISLTKADHDYCVKENVSLNCKTEELNCKNTWVQLKKVNNYLFSCCNQCSIQTICDYRVTLNSLSNVGILSVSSGCIIKDDRITLLSHKQSTNNIESKPDIPHIEIPTINNIVNVTMIFPSLEPRINETIIQKNLEDIGNQIDVVKKNTKTDLESNTFINNHDIHHYVLIYLLVTLAIVVVLAFCVRKIRGRRAWNAATEPPTQELPKPQPRARLSASHQCCRDSEINQCTIVSDQCNSEEVYAKVNKRNLPNKFNFSIVE